MPLGGGAPRQVQDLVHEADWGPGRQFVIIREVESMTRIEYPVGKVLHRTAGWQSSVRVSPDGKHIAFIDHPWRGNDAGNVAVMDLEGNLRILSTGWSSAQGLAWSPDSREVWFTAFRAESSRTMYAVTLDGALRPVFQTAGHLNITDISRQGRVLAIHGNSRMRMQALNLKDSSARDLTWLEWTLVRDISPDGKTILFDETGIGGGELHSVYLRDTDGSPAVRLGDGIGGRLSPDGRWALSGLEGPPPRLMLLPTGAGETRFIPTGKLMCHNFTWYPDGKRVYVVASEGSGASRIFEIDIESGAQRAVSEESVSPMDLLMSPDGSHVGTRGRDNVFTLYPVEGGEPKRLTAIGPGLRPFGWNAEGTGIRAFDRGKIPSGIYCIDVESGKTVLERELSPSDPSGVDGVTRVIISADESTMVYSYPQVLCDLYIIEGLR
jgi:dipeptidyl aminopeptidase/acylaminoacyl peptidase